MNATLIRFRGDARDIMTSNPVSLDEHVSLQRAAAFMTSMAVSAAPVINAAGRPLGVVSQTDILRHASRVRSAPDDATAFSVTPEHRSASFLELRTEAATVNEVMAPRVFTVGADASLRNVVEAMLSRNVHRLYVVDEQGVLVGVITALDLLRYLAK